MSEKKIGRKVTYAKFHTTLFAPNAGEVGDTLPPPFKHYAKDITMYATSAGLSVFGTFNTVSGWLQTELFVPYGNVKVLQMAQEDNPPAKILKAVSNE